MVVFGVAARLGIHQSAQAQEVGLVDAIGGERSHELLQREAGLEHLVEPRVDAVEVQHRGVDDRVDGRLDHDEPATGSAPHRRDLLVLHESHGLAEHGAAHAVTIEELRLGAEHFADRPALGHDVGEDLRRDGGGELRHRQTVSPGAPAALRAPAGS